VLDLSGMPDAKAFEENLAKKHKILIGKGLWARYLRGDVLPQGALSGAKASLPHRLNSIYPGTARLFFDDVWSLLEWQRTLDLNSLRKMYLNLGDDVAVHFVSKVSSKRERVYTMEATFWHLNKTIEERKRVLRLFTLWNRLVVDLLEARMAYAAQRPEVFVFCQLDASVALRDLQRHAADRKSPLVGLLLMMEGICLDVLLVHVMEQKSDNPKMDQLRHKARDTIKDWSWKCVIYLKSLAPKSRLDMVERFRTETLCGSDIDFMRMIKDTKFEQLNG